MLIIVLYFNNHYLLKTRDLLKKRNESGTFVVAVIVEPIQSEGGEHARKNT